MLALLRALLNHHDARFLASPVSLPHSLGLPAHQGVVVAVVVALVFGMVIWSQYRGHEGSPAHTLLRFARPVAWWSVAALLTTVLAWPLCGSLPIRHVSTGACRLNADGARGARVWHLLLRHDSFAEQNLAFACYYPVSLLWHLAPITLVGLVVVLIESLSARVL